ncbi:MAG TPA: enoyl-CoA hydratase/isomerase family protein [Steroidobacteraceae bacterium]|nr:enoyl-CoA hydratase/isomerase family protein [Steroidobacteraceae bacterium]
MSNPIHLDEGALLEAAHAGPATAAYSVLSDCACVVVELDGRSAAPGPPERAALSDWLNRQACAVVAVAAAGIDHPLAFACDAVAVDAEDLRELLTNIERAPIAAMVLTQLLRTTEGIDAERALVFESLAYATLQTGAEFQSWLRESGPPPRGAAAETGPAVRIERRGAELDLELNRPARRNALSVEMRDALVEALELVAADATIRRVYVSGAGKCFSTGGDLSEFGTAADAASAHAVRSTRSVPALLVRCAERLTFRVHGAAVGAGIEMAAFGRRIEASPDAFFQLPEIRYGLIPGSGGCVSVPRRIGRLRTAYWALSARRVDAHTAFAWGLVDALNERAVAASIEEL